MCGRLAAFISPLSGFWGVVMMKLCYKHFAPDGADDGGREKPRSGEIFIALRLRNILALACLATGVDPPRLGDCVPNRPSGEGIFPVTALPEEAVANVLEILSPRPSAPASRWITIAIR